MFLIFGNMNFNIKSSGHFLALSWRESTFCWRDRRMYFYKFKVEIISTNGSFVDISSTVIPTLMSISEHINSVAHIMERASSTYTCVYIDQNAPVYLFHQKVLNQGFV